MIALDGLERLESPGRWRPEAGADMRDVYVAVGEAELVIQSPDGGPLAHWSLPALVRANPGSMPALFAPDAGSDETLEIDEPEMADALDRVTRAVARGRRRGGRVRRATIVLGALGVAVLAALWLPGALRSHAAGVMPLPVREEIGNRLLARITELTGPPCTSPTGAEALETLAERLAPLSRTRMVVLRDLPQPSLALPGDLVAVSDATLVLRDDPELAAGQVLSTMIGAQRLRPIDRFLDALGPLELGRLLASGHVPEGAVARHAEALMLTGRDVVPEAALRQGFASARLAWAPFATEAGLDPSAPVPDMPPALDDTAWQALRGICDG